MERPQKRSSNDPSQLPPPLEVRGPASIPPNIRKSGTSKRYVGEESHDLAAIEEIEKSLEIRVQPTVVAKFPIIDAKLQQLGAGSRQEEIAEYVRTGQFYKALAVYKELFQESLDLLDLLGPEHQETIQAQFAAEKFAVQMSEIAEKILGAESRTIVLEDGKVINFEPKKFDRPTGKPPIKREVDQPLSTPSSLIGLDFQVDVRKERIARLQRVLTYAETPPDPVPLEIVDLGTCLNEDIHHEPPPDKEAFAKAVTAILDRTNYCIKIYPEEYIARKMYVNSHGSLMFQCPGGITPGLSQRMPSGELQPRRVELVPYRRTYTKKLAISPNP